MNNNLSVIKVEIILNFLKDVYCGNNWYSVNLYKI